MAPLDMTKFRKVEPIVLSKKQTIIMVGLFMGKTSQEIADTLFLSKKTVEGYRYRLYQKLEVRNSIGLVKCMVVNNLMSIEKGHNRKHLRICKSVNLSSTSRKFEKTKRKEIPPKNMNIIEL